MTNSLSRRLTAEFLGTAFLVAAVIGSGVMGERLANGNVALALLANTVATGAALVAIILAFGHCPEPILLIIGGDLPADWELAAYVSPRDGLLINLEDFGNAR